jgi:hypothetical protein
MKRSLFFGLLLFIVYFKLNAQNRKIDTTLQYGKAGYKVQVENKNLDKNSIIIRHIGFENTARDLNFFVKGKVVKAQTDDFNNDGFPDLLLYIYSGANFEKVTLMAIASSENKSDVPIYFPDILDDPKLRDGYKGFDEFSVMEGNLMRKFPLYKGADSTGKEIFSGKRVVIYRVVSDNGMLKFKPLNSYDLKE